MDFYKDRPLVLAHRGARADAPENTLAAFQKALDMGAQGIELDVMLSADGFPVVIHDSRLERTTNGTGRVSDHTAAQLQALDAGSHFSANFAGEPIPTLAQVLAAVGGQMCINVELKTTAIRDEGLESKTAALVLEHGLASSVVFSSFNPFSLWRARRAAPQIARGLLYQRQMPLPLRQAWAAPLLGLSAVHPHYQMVDAQYMAWARKKRYRVNVWTVNDPAEMERLLDLGVDALITDHPDLACQVVSRRQKR